MADLLTDLLIYTGIGIITFTIGMILGYRAADNVLYEALYGSSKGMLGYRFHHPARG